MLLVVTSLKSKAFTVRKVINGRSKNWHASPTKMPFLWTKNIEQKKRQEEQRPGTSYWDGGDSLDNDRKR